MTSGKRTKANKQATGDESLRIAVVDTMRVVAEVLLHQIKALEKRVEKLEKERG